jgi:hypothetical protein
MEENSFVRHGDSCPVVELELDDETSPFLLPEATSTVLSEERFRVMSIPRNVGWLGLGLKKFRSGIVKVTITWFC